VFPSQFRHPMRIAMGRGFGQRLFDFLMPRQRGRQTVA
jgi:hypothetical protein